jgi:hypothetical protein
MADGQEKHPPSEDTPGGEVDLEEGEIADDKDATAEVVVDENLFAPTAKEQAKMDEDKVAVGTMCFYNCMSLTYCYLGGRGEATSSG